MNYNKSIFVFIFCYILTCNGQPKLQPFAKPSGTKLPPCKMCRVLVDSFQKGIDRTVRGKHDGGDAAWEEEKLRSYKKSEVRLVEIQDMLCKDVDRHEDQCHKLAEDLESDIEEWWFNHQTEHSDLFKWLCIETSKVCCPHDHYGPNCDRCTECKGNGVCKGNGTRKGNGQCLCDTGYSGENCNECDSSYYEAFRDDEKLLCSICHVACDAGGCTTGSPKGCRVCKFGWLMDQNNGGCIDVNECAHVNGPCHDNQFCVNTDGSYKCLECDKSCNGCYGDGPDECIECSDGYELNDGICTDMASENRDRFVNLTRYLTYLGLCIATCVIFQSSTWIASIVGLAVAMYISVSEYWLKTTSTAQAQPKPTPFEITDF